MTAVIWEDGVEVNSTDDGAIVKSHQEYTINSWDELKDIDTSYCLQGSVVYNIKDSKFAVWDESEYWIDTDGNSYDGIPPVPELWKGFILYDIYAENTVPNGAVYNIYEGEPNALIPSASGIGDLAYNDFDVTSSNPDVISVQKEEVTSYGQTYTKVSITPHVQKGTVIITFTFPDYPMFYGKLTATIGGNPTDLYWYDVNGVVIKSILLPREWTINTSVTKWLAAYEVSQTVGETPTGSLPIHARTDEKNAFYVSDVVEDGEYYVAIEASSEAGAGVVEISVPSKDVLTYVYVEVQDDGGK